MPGGARAETGIEGTADALLVVEGLGFEGGGDGDDLSTEALITIEQPGEEVCLELVLTGLAGEDDDEGEAGVIEDGTLDGAGDLALVGTERDAGGTGPADGAAAEGLTGALGEEDCSWRTPRKYM